MDGLLVDLRDNVSITMYFDFTYSGLHRCVVFFLLIVSLLHYLAIQLSRLQVCCNKISCQLLGCPKLTKRSQPLVGRRSPYCEDMWRRYCCLTSFFPTVDTCLSCEDTAGQSCAMVRKCRIFGDFLGPVFSASRVQHVSDLHSKFALRPHHVWKYGRHPISDC